MRLEGIETSGPHPSVWREPGVDLDQRFGSYLVDPALGIDAHRHETRIPQYPQMLGDTRLRQAEIVDELADGALPFAQQIQDLSARGLGKCSERHPLHMPLPLYSCQGI